MKVEYVGGAWSPGEMPKQRLPEVAIIGRSNVGKSSLVNTLVRQRQMARVSSTPGRTQALHFFRVGDAVCLVDLPGFGYAKVPVKVRKGLMPLVETYLAEREPLRAGLLLVDIRREPGDEERAFVERVRARGLALLLVVTKTDKLARTRCPGRLQALGNALAVPKADVFGFSSLTGDGREALWDRILALVEGP